MPMYTTLILIAGRARHFAHAGNLLLYMLVLKQCMMTKECISVKGSRDITVFELTRDQTGCLEHEI
jgi:hypothetical protein